MSLHPSFPAFFYEELLPKHRWISADEALLASAYDKLLPPFVASLRHKIQAWRTADYSSASPISRALLNHFSETEHPTEYSSIVQSFAKNYLAVDFRQDYFCDDGDFVIYKHDFIVRITADAARTPPVRYGFVLLDRAGLEKYPPAAFAGLATAFTDYKA